MICTTPRGVAKFAHVCKFCVYANFAMAVHMTDLRTCVNFAYTQILHTCANVAHMNGA